MPDARIPPLRLWANLMFDQLPGGNHRRGRAGAYVATDRMVQPSSPSARRAAASCSARHSSWQALWNPARASPFETSSHAAPATNGLRQRKQAARETGDTISNPLVDPVALVANGRVGLRRRAFNRRRGDLLWLGRGDNDRRMLDHRRWWRQCAFESVVAATISRNLDLFSVAPNRLHLWRRKIRILPADDDLTRRRGGDSQINRRRGGDPAATPGPDAVPMVNMLAARRSRPSLLRNDAAMFRSARSILDSTISNDWSCN